MDELWNAHTNSFMYCVRAHTGTIRGGGLVNGASASYMAGSWFENG